MKRKGDWIEASSSKKQCQIQSNSIGKSQLEDLCNRFPQIGVEILKCLDDKSIAKFTMVSKRIGYVQV